MWLLGTPGLVTPPITTVIGLPEATRDVEVKFISITLVTLSKRHAEAVTVAEDMVTEQVGAAGTVTMEGILLIFSMGVVPSPCPVVTPKV